VQAWFIAKTLQDALMQPNMSKQDVDAYVNVSVLITSKSVKRKMTVIYICSAC